ncbi:alcohol dehydrogenase [Dactylosporangium sp. CA-092794]|uniref:alcohol dehydrogenase n=1 Tax=Dactylosporangium sp. CA-092794 TaxID=3239929 RepID=UPI003D92D64E
MANDPAIRAIDVDVPEPEGSEVVLRVGYAGVCHSDVHLQLGYYDLGSRGHMRLTDRGIPYPLVLGHEIVGVVERVGPDVTGTRAGDLRLVYPWIGCGTCHRCAAGTDHLCSAGRVIGVNRHGGYAELVRVPHERYLLNIEGVEPAYAATLACSGVTAFGAVQKVLPLPPSTPVVVIGAGGVGLTVVAVLVARGHEQICVVDVNEDNLELARKLGASATVLAGPELTAAQITAVTEGPVAAVIDLVNSTQTAAVAFDSLAKGGRLVQVGLFGGELVIPTPLMPLKVATLQGSYVGSLGELRELVALAKLGSLPRPPILTGVLDRDGVSTSLGRLAAGGVPGRIVLSASHPGGSGS